MADIAAIFHWTPEVLNAMSLSELLSWRYQAYLRSGAGNEQ
ncbi:GpE family phage tail protein [Salmonella enterica]|uniref:GpE family phage tail protein n=1 Tax=Salmonella enterica I TaxID=59201 RepID=A0A5U3F1V4_SALET|nr:GpE family phage tail protein [Salmonella enterica subsp. diarizonae]EBP3998758.1 GpE family phage tail protein [Salmonella enterica subsp. enterica]ELB6470202.1 GpE family phage tail protein [Salmonella enterica]